MVTSAKTHKSIGRVEFTLTESSVFEGLPVSMYSADAKKQIAEHYSRKRLDGRVTHVETKGCVPSGSSELGWSFLLGNCPENGLAGSVQIVWKE